MFCLRALAESEKFSNARLVARQALVSWPLQFHSLLSHVVRRRGDREHPVVDRRYLLGRSQGLAKFIGRKHCTEVTAQIERFFDARRVSSGCSVGTGELFINPCVKTYGHVSRSLRTGEDLAHELGWTAPWIEDAVITLGLPFTRLPNRRIALDSEVAGDFAREVRGYILYEQAADGLGVSVSGLFHLMHIAEIRPRCIELQARRGTSGTRPLTLISASSYGEIRRAIFDRCRRLPPRGAGGWMPLGDMLEPTANSKGQRRAPYSRAGIRVLARNQRAVAEALAAILSGALDASCIREPMSLSDVLVTSDFRHCSAIRQEAPL